MKKYLMTGLAAIAICAAFTSCSKNDELYNPEQIRQNEVASVYDNYNRAFIETFGQPAANQDWGFGSLTKTRGYVDPNGNMWEGEPSVGANEPTEVSDYVAALQSLPMSKPSNLTDFYVTHIWKGTDTYTAFTGGEPFTGSDIMDQLIIADKDNFGVDKAQGTLNAGAGNPGGADAVWHHIFDFNGGQNVDYSGNMLMKDSGTKNFAYWNSKDGKWHDRWIAVNGADIDAHYGYTGSNKKYSGYWYICFDYEGTPKENSESFTIVSWKVPGINAGELVEQKMQIQGIHTLESLAAAGTVLSDNKTGQNKGNFTVYQEGTSDWKIDQVSQGDKYTPGDGVYTDWIIRLVKAEDDPEPEWDIRIIAEDLNAKANDSDPAKDGLEESDWDFNDVVFDIKFKDGEKADIHVVCVGGVLPLYVAGQEVHELCGQNKGTDGLYRILGTVDARVFEVSNVNKNNYKDNIKVEVGKVLSDGTTEIFELPAPVGKPTAKIAVKTSYVPCAERVDIRTQYHQFGLWITNSSVMWY